MYKIRQWNFSSLQEEPTKPYTRHSQDIDDIPWMLQVKAVNEMQNNSAEQSPSPDATSSSTLSPTNQWQLVLREKPTAAQVVKKSCPPFVEHNVIMSRIKPVHIKSHLFKISFNSTPTGLPSDTRLTLFS